MHPIVPQRHFRDDNSSSNSVHKQWDEFVLSEPALAPPPIQSQPPNFMTWPAPTDLPWLPSFGEAMADNGSNRWPSPSAVNMPDLFPFPPPFLPHPSQWPQRSSDEFPWLPEAQPLPQQELRSSSYNANSFDERSRLKALAENARKDFAHRGRSASQSSMDSTSGSAPRSNHLAEMQTARLVTTHRAITSRMTEDQLRQLKEQRDARINARRNSVLNPKLQPDSSRKVRGTSPVRDARFRSPTASSMRRTPVRAASIDAKQPVVAAYRPSFPHRSHSAAKGVTVTALKGEIPSLHKTMRLGQPSERRRLEPHSTSKLGPTLYDSDKHQSQHSSFVGFGAAQYTPFVELAKKDPRAAEYLRGIETLYTNLRSSYESFQKNPAQFLKEKGPTTTAIQNAVATNLVAKHFDPASSQEHLAANSSVPLAAARTQPSAETRQLRMELDRLEHQWQSLAELRIETSNQPTLASQPQAQHQHPNTKQDIFSYDNVLSFVRERKVN
jgi:hypothetical protein